jgi:hypothetical protein
MIEFHGLNNKLDYRIRVERKFSMVGFMQAYNDSMKGKEEPHLVIISQYLHDLFVRLSEDLPNKLHLDTTNKFWRKFRNASVVISSEMERNEALFLNLNLLSDLNRNILLRFEDANL